MTDSIRRPMPSLPRYTPVVLYAGRDMHPDPAGAYVAHADHIDALKAANDLIEERDNMITLLNLAAWVDADALKLAKERIVKLERVADAAREVAPFFTRMLSADECADSGAHQSALIDAIANLDRTTETQT